jgi:hypothetical protein
MRALVLAAVLAAGASGVFATLAQGTGTPVVKSVEFYSPLRPGIIGCELSDPSSLGYNVFCQLDPVNSPRLTTLIVKMSAAGRLTLCKKNCPIGDLGEGTRVLGYGKQATIGRFRCLSLRTGVRCIVIRSGKGFLISSKGVKRVGP